MLKEKYYKENENKIKAALINNSKKNEAGQEVISKNDTWVSEKEWDDIYVKLADERIQ